ncbi:hypothetical protein PINS_up003149 [Pythium insidiosum]|nr:hypothetical protein PINS_up003149 [Pythium insidiosum]
MSTPKTETSRLSTGSAFDDMSKLRNSAIAAAAAGLAIDAPTPSSHPPSVGSASLSTLDDTIADQLRSKVEIADIRAGFFTTHNACVSGFDLIYTLKREFSKTEEEAYNCVSDLLASKVLSLVAAESMESPELNRGDTYLRFQVDEIFVPLNMKHICIETIQQTAMDACLAARQMAEELHRVESFPRGISTGFKTPNALPSDSAETNDFDSNLCRLYTEVSQGCCPPSTS